MQVSNSSTVRSIPTEQRLDWGLITATAVTNGVVQAAVSYVGAKLGQNAKPGSQPSAEVILPLGVDRK